MNRREDLVSLCERKFVLEALRDSKRVDGRDYYDFRNVHISLSKEPGGGVEVTLGRTRVLACASCQVIQPKPHRPTEGVIFFNVELSPMASPSFEAGRQSSLSVEVTRILERCLKESRAVDTESLCIIAGQKVWEVRIDLHVLDYVGNIIDCATIAAISALKHCRRPDVTVVGEEATVHPLSERDPVPLSVHHMPICCTFAFFLDGEYMVVDPSLEEEQVMEGKLVVGMNIHREVCVLQILGGVAILPEQMMRCTQIAGVKCAEITEMIKNSLSGKTADTFKNVESILQNTRQCEEVDSPAMEEGEGQEVGEREGRKEEESMEEEPAAKVNYLGPGTAELVGMGGANTWEVLDSIENCSDEDKMEDILLSPASDQKVKPSSKFSGTEKRGSDSEEENTVLLTGTNPVGVVKQEPAAKPASKPGGKVSNGGKGTGKGAGKKKRRTKGQK